MNFRERDLTIQGRVALKGTLSIPEHRAGKGPAVLIIPGTGKIDRNGKAGKNFDLKLYRQLSEFLTSIGLINLRYDKRGIGESEGDYYTTGVWDLVDGARTCVQFLKDLPEVDSEKVIVLGHSEGSMLSTALAAREEVVGIILLSGANESLSEALKRQRTIAIQDVIDMKGLKGILLRLLRTERKIEPQAQKMMDKILHSNEDMIKIKYVKMNAKWMREHFAYNPKEDLAKIACPVLAVTGARDIQANPEALMELPKYQKNDLEFFVIDNMGHSCKFQSKTSTILTAKKDILMEAKLPIHPELLSIIEKWLQNHFVKDTIQENTIIV